VIDRQKVIEGLKICGNTHGADCPKCPYFEQSGDSHCAQLLRDAVALVDLPDTPAPEDLTPYLTAADVGPLDDYCRNDGWDKQLKRWAEAKIAAARALRDAAKGLS
jgi:hypothetical protein